MFCPTGIANYFAREDWTGFSLICPSGKSGASSMPGPKQMTDAITTEDDDRIAFPNNP
jgi:hypothetical protein